MNTNVLVVVLLLASTIHCANNIFAFGVTRTDNASSIATTPSAILTTLANSDYFVAVSVGAEHTLFLSSRGVVYGMGNSAGGRLGQGVDINTYITTPTPIVDTFGVLQGKTITSIHAGNSTSSIFASDGNVYTFGTNNNGALGNISSTVNYAPLPIYDSNGALFSGGRTITSVTQSGDTVMMTCNDGNIFGFGFNGFYQLGDGFNTDRPQPYQLVDGNSRFQTGTKPVQLSIGYRHVIARFDNNAVYTWGDGGLGNTYGDEVLGRSTIGKYPDRVSDPNSTLTDKNIIQVVAGWDTSFIVTSAGDLFAWGNNTYGQLCLGHTDTPQIRLQRGHYSLPTNIVKVAAGNKYTLLLTSTGVVYACGQTSSGQLGLGRTSPDAVIPEKLTSLSSSIVTDVRTTVNGRPSSYASVGGPQPPATTAEPIPSYPQTQPPVTYATPGSWLKNITGDSTKIPPPQKTNSFVLFNNASVNSGISCTFNNETPLKFGSFVTTAELTFNVSFISDWATIVVLVTDEDGTQAGNVTRFISQSGQVTISLRSLYQRILNDNQKNLIVRAIRGNILKVAVNIADTNVQINVDPGVVSTTIIADPSSATPTPATPATTNTPATGTPKPTNSGSIIPLCYLLLCLVLFVAN